MYILLAIFIFSTLIFIHELGHFIVARLCGVKVLEFAIGMGPRILSVKSRKTETVYAIRLFPIGGFVSMLGENGMEPVQGSAAETEQNDAENTPDQLHDPHAYANQSVWKRILISVAGPAMNIILGFVLMLVMVLSMGADAIGNTTVANFHVVYSAENAYHGLQKGDYLLAIDGTPLDSFSQLTEIVSANPDGSFDIIVQRLDAESNEVVKLQLDDVSLQSAQLKELFTSSLSEQSGLQIGDVITKVNRTGVHTAHELSYEIANQGYAPLQLTVIRNGEKTVLENIVVPSYVESGVTFGNMDFRVWAEKDFGIGTVLKHTWFRSLSTVKMVFDSLGGLFSGRYGAEAVSGPIGITKTISDAAKTGIMNVLYLVIVISINLGVMNLLPIPALDGGHLLIYFVEAIRRKPMKQEVEAIINFVGLILMLALIVIVAIKDIISL